MANSIPISGLSVFSTITGSDFIPLVDSSSLTTYRSTLDTLQLYLNTSGSSIPTLASSSISSSYSDFAKFASSSFAATSASWASASVISISSFWASASKFSTSSSWASSSDASISSSWASMSFSSISASFVTTAATIAISASWASSSITSISSSWASSSISSSYSNTASYSNTSSYALIASAIVPSGGTTKFFTNLGGSWMVCNPGGAFVNGNDLYVFNYDQQSTKRNLIKIDMRTNNVTYKIQWPSAAWKWYGRLFRSSNDGQPHALFFTDQGLYNYNVTANTVSGPTIGAYYYDLPVIADFADPLHPTIWTLPGSWGAGGGYGDYPYFYLVKYHWNGSTYIRTDGSVLNLTGVNNASVLIPFFNSATGHQATARNTLLWDYNYIKKRYYLIADSTGYMHLFNQTTGTPNDGTNWLASSITYEKTIALSLPNVETVGDLDVDKITIDYDIDTGDEKGVIMTRRGLNLGSNVFSFGSVTYVNWPENGNW